MAKLESLSLEELYARKITSSVEQVIMFKEDFSQKSDNWCSKVCKLNCKNPPPNSLLVPKSKVDILIIQDHRAFDEPKFKRRGSDIERKHLEVIQDIASKAFIAEQGEAPLSYAVTSLLKCQLQSGDIKKGKAPTDTILSKCRPYLLAEIEERKPKVIISLSTAATKAMGFKKTNYSNRGEIYNNIVFTLHPRILLMLRQNSSGKMWGPDFYEIIKRDFKKAAALARNKLRNPDLTGAVDRYKKNVFVAKTLKDVDVFYEELKTAGFGCEKIISYDTETNTLDPFAPDAKILTMQFGYRHDDGHIKALVIPMWHRRNTFYDPDQALDIIRGILEDEAIAKVGHNAKFDVLMTATTTGVRIKNMTYDTMLLLHHLDSGTQGNLGLKRAVWDWLPETELGGYEDLLPGLSTTKELEKMDEENEQYEDV